MIRDSKRFSNFTLEVVEKRCWADESTVEAFLDTGFTRPQVPEGVRGAQKALSNHSHPAGIPVNPVVGGFSREPAPFPKCSRGGALRHVIIVILPCRIRNGSVPGHVSANRHLLRPEPALARSIPGGMSGAASKLYSCRTWTNEANDEMQMEKAATQKCAACSREAPGEAAYKMRSGDGTVLKCLRCSLLHRPLLLSASKSALAVGTILTLLNHGDKLWGPGPLTDALFWKVPLTYLVPFCVTIYGALSNARS